MWLELCILWMSPPINRDPNQLPGFLFPLQVATLMIVETKDLIPLIAPMIFSAFMALRYPTQVLRVATNAPSLSILHFVITNGPLQGPTYASVIRNFANLRPPMAYAVIKERRQVEHNYLTLIRAPARCALPVPLEFHPVAWLHVRLDPNNGAVATFIDWDEPMIIRILNTIIQSLGGRKRDEKPTGLHHSYVCDTSRMYCIRAEPRVQTARILEAITCWTRPELVDLAIHQQFQHMRTKVSTIAREPNRKNLPISAEVPNNPRIALEIFLRLHSLQREQGQAVNEDYARGIQTFKNLFARYGHQELADGLPELAQDIGGPNTAAPGRLEMAPPTMNPPNPAESLMDEVQGDAMTTLPPSEEPMTDDNFTLSDAATPVQDEPEASISHMDAADIESELNNLLTNDDASPDPYMVTDSATAQEPAGNTSNQEPLQNQSAE